MKHITSILYTISFLDSICYGLIMPVLPTHILILGGNHTILGLHAMLHISFQLFSEPLSNFLNDHLGKKLNLKSSLLMGVVTSVLMGMYPSYLVIIMLRGVYYLINQTQCVIKALNMDLIKKEDQTGVGSTLNILGIFGFILGPILGGYIFEKSAGFFLLSLLTAFFYFLSLVLSGFLPVPVQNNPKEPNIPFNQIIFETVQPFLNTIRIFNLNNSYSRNVLVLRFLTTFSLTVFFTKFPLLLKVHYLSSHSQVGWTIAYQNFAVLLSSLSLTILEKKFALKEYHKLRRFLSVLTISSAAICFAPTYEMYLIGFVFMALSKIFVDSAWKEIEKTADKNLKGNGIEESLTTVNVLGSVTAPVVLGVLCDIYLQNAIKMLTIVPLVIASFLASYYYERTVNDAQNVKKEDKNE